MNGQQFSKRRCVALATWTIGSLKGRLATHGFAKFIGRRSIRAVLFRKKKTMADQTKIEWTDATWNPVTGCAVVSPGCANCYAMKLAGTRLRHHPSRAGLTRGTKAGPVWTGEVRFNEDWLFQPLRWKRPRRIFVCAHGDLFAEGVPAEWINRVFAVMALAPQHTFQVLTKRAERMRGYLAPGAWRGARESIGNCAQAMSARFRVAGMTTAWPLPNVWLGVSAEDQVRADERIPDLLATPAAKRFVSAEPLLGPIEFNGASSDRRETWNWLRGEIGMMYSDGPDFDYGAKLDWIIVGGESGPHFRAMEFSWARAIRDQCEAAGAAFFFKQAAARRPTDAMIPDDLRVRKFPRDAGE